MKFQTTNTSVVVWFWVNSMLVFEVVLYCLDLMNGCKKKGECWVFKGNVVKIL